MLWNVAAGKLEWGARGRAAFPDCETRITLGADGAQFLLVYPLDQGDMVFTLNETATGKKLRGWSDSEVFSSAIEQRIGGMVASDPTVLSRWNTKVTFHGGCVATINPDGSLIAASDHGLIMLFNAATGKKVAEWQVGKTVAEGEVSYTDIQALAFSPDGGTLASGDAAR